MAQVRQDWSEAARRDTPDSICVYISSTEGPEKKC